MTWEEKFYEINTKKIHDRRTKGHKPLYRLKICSWPDGRVSIGTQRQHLTYLRVSAAQIPSSNQAQRQSEAPVCGIQEVY